MHLRSVSVAMAALLAVAFVFAPRGASAPEEVAEVLAGRAADAPQAATDRSAVAPAPSRRFGFRPSGPVVADLGFRPAPNGFSFQNYASNYPQDPGDLTIESARRLFGDSVCAQVVEGGACVPSPLAEQWVAQMNTFLNLGRCEGLAALSQAMYLQRLSPGQLEPGASAAYDLRRDDPDVDELVAMYSVTQFLEPVASATAASRALSPSQILDALVASLQPGADPPTLGMYDPDVGGHAVTPFAVEDRGGGLFRVWLYDNNFPGAAKYLEIDRVADTWSYAAAALNPRQDPAPWSGDGQSFTLDLTPASARTAQLVCPFCGGPAGDAGAPRQLAVTGDVRMLAVDQSGRRIGQVGGRFVNEIPGAYRQTWRSAAGAPAGTVYYVPADVGLTVTLAGGAQGAQGQRFAMFAPGGALTVSELGLGGGRQDVLSIEPGGSVSYAPGGPASPAIELAVDADDAQYVYTIGRVELRPGAALEFSVDQSSGRLRVSSDAGGVADGVVVRRVAEGGRASGATP